MATIKQYKCSKCGDIVTQFQDIYIRFLRVEVGKKDNIRNLSTSQKQGTVLCAKHAHEFDNWVNGSILELK